MVSLWNFRRRSKVISLFASLFMLGALLYHKLGGIQLLVRKTDSYLTLIPHGSLNTTSGEPVGIMSFKHKTELPVHRNASPISPYLYKMAKPGVFESLPDQFLNGYKSSCWMFANRELLCLPYFYIIGMMKCGTTELWGKVKKHPDIIDVGKEINWWPYAKAKYISFESYLSKRSSKMVRLMQEREILKTRLITGDGSPSTLWDNQNWREIFGDNPKGPEYVTADLLHAVQPNAKIIITLREPSSRLYSHYLHYHYPDCSPDIFHRSTVETIARYRECRKNMTMRACTYTNSIMNDVKILLGLYVVYVKDWLRVFPRSQIYIQRLEDWHGHCSELLPKIFTFLELESLPTQNITEICRQLPGNDRKSRLRKIGPMHNETRKILRTFYAESNRLLSELLDNDRYLWNDITEI